MAVVAAAVRPVASAANAAMSLAVGASAVAAPTVSTAQPTLAPPSAPAPVPAPAPTLATPTPIAPDVSTAPSSAPRPGRSLTLASVLVSSPALAGAGGAPDTPSGGLYADDDDFGFGAGQSFARSPPGERAGATGLATGLPPAAAAPAAVTVQDEADAFLSALDEF